MDKYVFRGKSKSTGEWVYGSLWGGDDPKIIVLTDAAGTEAGVVCHVVADTVGIGVWASDKNGKLIFEGDILRDKFEDELAVVTKGEGGIYIAYPTWVEYDWGHAAFDFEVVGNIHDDDFEVLEAYK